MFRWPIFLLCIASSLFAQRVGSRACTPCHGDIAARYQKSAMGSSMARANSSHVEHPVTVGNYSVYERDGEIYQNSYKLDFLIGSGVNGQTFLAQRGPALVEAPLTYYNRESRWDLSPGYEKVDAGFSRVVPEGCIACHSARSFIDPNDLAVGCESCHGPGKAHVARPSGANIVNPAKLKKFLADDVCMYCHQGGDARVLLPGKHYADFKPGEPLNKTIAIFKAPVQKESDLLEHHAAMRLSKCYRASAGKMNCLTCHDPHKPVNYNQRCLECHSKDVHPAGKREDCVACHMPKRTVTQISHAALTNHRIVARPDEALPASNPSIFFNGEMADLPEIVKLAAFGELGMQREYLEMLDSLARSMPQDPLVRASLGRRALLMGKPTEAIHYLQDASTVPSLLDLAQAYKALGRQAEAIPPLERAAKLEPLNSTARKTLVLAYIETENYVSAKSEMQRYVADFPEDTFMKGLLQKVSSR